MPEEYCQGLEREFLRMAPRNPAGEIVRPATVYFGGGTPGLLSPRQVARLLEVIQPVPGAEVTLETNPETADYDKLAGWRKAGVNRLSVGVQTADDQSLKRLGRLHTAQQAGQVLREAAKAGFDNVSGDIMLALPCYSTGEFDRTLALLQKNGVVHISAYLLKIEEGTAFYKNLPEGIPEEDAAADFYTYAVEQLERGGYRRYEISSFAREGRQGKHNRIYWDCGNYLGIGPAAHSCMEGRRFSYPEDTAGFLAKEPVLVEEGRLSPEEYCMLRLRLEEGLEEKQLLNRFGVGLTMKQREFLYQLAGNGLAKNHGGAWSLTTQGILVQNSILAKLLE